MREFDQRIETWKKQAMTELGGDAERVAELECHLRQSLEELSAAPGRSAEETWKLAMGRLGGLGELKREFGKIESAAWIDKAAVGAIIFVAFMVFMALLLPWLARGDHPGDILLHVHVGMIFAGYMLSIAAGVLGVYLGIRRMLDASSNAMEVQSMHKAFAWMLMSAGASSATGFVLGMMWAARHMGGAWSNDPKEIGGAIVVLSLGTLSSLLLIRKMSPMRAIALSPLLIPITVGAWFATMFALESEVHSYGMMTAGRRPS